MRAWCEGCGRTSEVPPEALFDFAATCEACGGGLIIEEGEEDDLEAAGFGPATSSAEEEERRADTGAYRKAAEALAAGAASLGGAPGFELPSDRPSTRLLAGRVAEEPPLPSFDGGDTQEVSRIAKLSPSGRLLPPVDVGGESLADVLARGGTGLTPPAGVPKEKAKAPEKPKAPEKGKPAEGGARGTGKGAARPTAEDAVAAVVPMPAGGSTGRGSRVFDREQAAPADGKPGNGRQGAANPARTASGRQPRPGSGRDKSATDRTARPAPSRLFDEDDLDWARLVDDQLTELPAEDPTARRNVVKLPPNASLQSESDLQKIGELQGLADLPDMLPPPPRGGPVASKDADTVSFRLGKPSDEPPTDAIRKGDRRPGRGDDEPPTAPMERPGRAARDEPPTETIQRVAAKERLEGPKTETIPRADVAAARAVAGVRRRRVAEGPPVDPTPGHVVDQLRADRLDPALATILDPKGAAAARYQALARRLLDLGDAIRSVLVVSAEPGEGRTAVAANLAVAVARQEDRSAVLVDADPRGRGLPSTFGLGPSAGGLLEALRAKADPGPWLHHLPLGKLDLLPLGTPGEDASQLLAGPPMSEALGQLARRTPAGLVVLDGPSALGPGGLLGLDGQADGAVLVVRAGTTKRARARAAAQLVRGRLLGVVLVE